MTSKVNNEPNSALHVSGSAKAELKEENNISGMSRIKPTNSFFFIDNSELL
jgi:hypothetical protein